MKKIGGGVTS